MSEQIYLQPLLVFNSLLYKLQSGFFPGYSTILQLVELYHNILLVLDNKEMTKYKAGKIWCKV